MKEQFLYGYLLRYGTVGIALPPLPFHSSLDASHLDVTLQDGFVTNDPDDLIDNIGRRVVDID